MNLKDNPEIKINDSPKRNVEASAEYNSNI